MCQAVCRKQEYSSWTELHVKGPTWKQHRSCRALKGRGLETSEPEKRTARDKTREEVRKAKGESACKAQKGVSTWSGTQLAATGCFQAWLGS